MRRYFEITVCEYNYRKTKRWTDMELSFVIIPLGELLELEIETLRQHCVEAKASEGEGNDCS